MRAEEVESKQRVGCFETDSRKVQFNLHFEFLLRRLFAVPLRKPLSALEHATWESK
jgi:hypothetical protein